MVEKDERYVHIILYKDGYNKIQKIRQEYNKTAEIPVSRIQFYSYLINFFEKHKGCKNADRRHIE